MSRKAPHPPRRAPAPERPEPPPSRGGAWALAAVLALAVALRLRNLAYGLPDFGEEALPFRKAIEMWEPDGGVDWNPRLFHYPSLTIYLQLLVQKLHYALGSLAGTFANPADYLVGFATDPTTMVIAGRLVSVVAGVATVALAARIAERLRRGAGWLAGLLVATAPTQILASRSILTDTVMAALVLAALDRMLAWRERGGRRRLAAAALLTGLAAGAKYPAAVLLLPLAAALWARRPRAAPGRWVAAAALAALVFLATTPYAILDRPAFARDFAFVSLLGAHGHLGNIEGTGFLYYLRTLAGDLGWPAIGLLLAGAATAIARPRGRPDAVVVTLAFLAFAAPISLAHVLAERYLAPVVPLAAALAAAAAFALMERLPARSRRVAVALASVALALRPLALAADSARALGPSTALEARRWCEAHLTRDDLVVQELYGAAILSRLDAARFRASAAFRAASPPARARYEARRWFGAALIPLAVVGRMTNVIRPRGAPPAELAVFPHVADVNQACYDPRLFAGVDYVVTSGAVRGRYEADPRRYAAQDRFYRLLDSTAEVAARFHPRVPGAGPEIVVYRMGARAREAIAGLGPLDPLWWADHVPAEYRERAEALLEPPGRRTAGTRRADGGPAAWVTSLADFFAVRYQPFAEALAMEHLEHGRPDLTRRMAGAILAVRPGDVGACLLYSDASGRLGAWAEARAALERGIAWTARGEAPSPYLVLEHAEVLARLGETERARREMERVAASGDAYLAAEARRRLADPDGPFRGPR